MIEGRGFEREGLRSRWLPNSLMRLVVIKLVARTEWGGSSKLPVATGVWDRLKSQAAPCSIESRGLEGG